MKKMCTIIFAFTAEDFDSSTVDVIEGNSKNHDSDESNSDNPNMDAEKASSVQGKRKKSQVQILCKPVD